MTRKFFIITVCLFCLSSIASAESLLLISKFLANPKGEDKGNEWIELMNGSGAPFDLSGYKLDNREGGSKPYPLHGMLEAGKSLRFFSRDTKITLRNKGDEVRLIGPQGELMDMLSWNKEMKEGAIALREDFSFLPDTAKVIAVIDGDTIEVEIMGGSKRKEKVRLIGVDTPETVDPGKPVQYFGKEASEYTKSQLLHKDVRLEYDQEKRDEYNRLLAYVHVEGRFFNAELIEKGYARALTFFPFKFVHEFRQIEAKAKEQGVGRWATPLDISDSLLTKVLQAVRDLLLRVINATSPQRIAPQNSPR